MAKFREYLESESGDARFTLVVGSDAPDKLHFGVYTNERNVAVKLSRKACISLATKLLNAADSLEEME